MNSVSRRNIYLYAEYAFCVLVFAVGLTSSYYIYAAPAEQIMGIVQKIMYLHVGAAVATYTMLGIAFISSVCFLSSKNFRFYYALDASTLVSFLFCSIVLLTGMIWGHSSWNTWWRWEPRLTSVLILWILLFAVRYLQFARYALQEKAMYMSIVGILSSIQVPIVMFSIKLLKRTEQLHPEVVAKRGLEDSGYVTALITSNISIILLSLLFFLILFKVNSIEGQRFFISRKTSA